jgi:hypothetical protein
MKSMPKLCLTVIGVLFMAYLAVPAAAAGPVVTITNTTGTPAVSAPSGSLFDINNFDPGDCAVSDLTFINQTSEDFALSLQDMSQIFAAPAGLVFTLFDHTGRTIIRTDDFYHNFDHLSAYTLPPYSTLTLVVEMCLPAVAGNEYQGLDNHHQINFGIVQKFAMGAPATGWERLPALLREHAFVAVVIVVTMLLIAMILLLPRLKRRAKHD